MTKEKCAAELHIGDDEGDNHATMICGLDKGHGGKHQELYPRQVGRVPTTVEVRWEGNDKTT